MARLGPSEIAQIEAVVNQMVVNLQSGMRAIRYDLHGTSILGAKLGLTSKSLDDDCLDLAAISASYHPNSGNINLEGNTWHPSEIPDTETLDAFRRCVTAALAHEVCHLMQHREEKHRFGPGSEADVASALSRTAASSELPEDYIKYVSCALEMEAHATQLAAELREHGQLERGQLERGTFEAEAKVSDLMAHVKRKSSLPAGTASPTWASLETALIDEAWAASEKMWGR